MAAMATIRDFHAHIYYDPAEVGKAQALAWAAQDRFGVPVGHFHLRPVGRDAAADDAHPSDGFGISSNNPVPISATREGGMRWPSISSVYLCDL